jgi:GNAT superfamily N-acetyltransferase
VSIDPTWLLSDPEAEDLPEIAGVWHQGWHDGHADIVPDTLRRLRTLDSFRRRAADHLSRTRVAKNGAAVIGFAMVRSDEVYQMYAAPAARGRDVAKALMADAEARIRGSGYRIAWLSCAVGNTRAMRFYEKCGWRNCGPERVEVETSEGPFTLEVLRYEKSLAEPCNG